MKEENKPSMTNSVQVLIAPWERGFTCGVIVSSSTKMTTEQYEMCSTVARGMIKLATEIIIEKAKTYRKMLRVLQKVRMMEKKKLKSSTFQRSQKKKEMSHFPKIIIILVLFISKIEAAEHSNNFVLECFALDDRKYDFRYYSVVDYNLYYINEKKIITKIQKFNK